MSNDAQARLIIEAVVKFGFRLAILPGESPKQYVQALVQHVAARDLTAAQEIVLGRPVAEWTRDEGLAFKDRLLEGWTGPREEVPAGEAHAGYDVQRSSGFAVTAAQVLVSAAVVMETLAQARVRDPDRELPIYAFGLLTTSELLTAQVSRVDRLAVVKWFARTEPLFGWGVVADAFIHGVDTRTGAADKRECILAHVGTREMRRIKRQPYLRSRRGNVILEEPLEEIDLCDPASPWRTGADPYAGIFVSVPPPTGKPS